MLQNRQFRSWMIGALLLLLSVMAACGPQATPGEPLSGTTPRPTTYPPQTAPAEGATATPEEAPPPRAGVLVIDNADPGFAVLSGDWGECWGKDCSGTPYGESFRFADPGCADCQALFVLTVSTAGDYDVWAWWPGGEDRATDTPFVISYGGDEYTAEVDQRNNGDGWFWLATLSFPAGPVRIVVGGVESGYANADAVALTPAGTGDPGEGSESPAEPTAEPSSPTVPPVVATLPPVAPGGAIVVDYRMSDISRIPEEWIARAKQLTIHYAHTSHGSQIITGLEWLAAQDPRYAVAVRYAGDGIGLPDTAGALRILDGNPPDDYITPELYWSTREGLDRTRAVANTGLFNFSMWSWCGQQSENDRGTVQQYLDELDRLERAYPGMRFVYMTGHTDGGSDILSRNNDMVRAYVRENGKVLFDFATFEMYDPDGNYYPEAGDACDWCESWCRDHPGDCRNLDEMGDCAHTHPLQCKLKAQAFWWMMALLAGWDGQPY